MTGETMTTDTASAPPVSTIPAAAVDAVDRITVATVVLDEATLPLTPHDAGPIVPRSQPARSAADRGTRAPREDLAGRAPVRASITTTAHRHDRVLIRVRGRLDRVGVARLRTALAQARAVGSPQLVLDLRSVTWWDHNLARALGWARLQLRGRDQDLVLIGASAGLCAEIAAEEYALGCPLWRGLRPGDLRRRPEIADQP